MVMGLVMAGVTASLSPSLRNQVRIAKDRFTHRKFSVPTSSITRFEYGTKEQLTGAKEVGLDSKTLHNPTIIRLWVGDATAYEISRNNWQTQVNHEIQTALTKALETVRDFDKQQKHAQEFGTVSTDTGMPDY